MKNPNVYQREVLTEKNLFEESGHKNNFASIIEPKRNNRFIVEFPAEFELESWVVQKLTKPKFSVSRGWGDIEIFFLDVIAPSTSEKLYDLMRWCSGRKTKSRKKDYELFSFSISALDPVGIKVEQWVIHAKDAEFDFGTFDYGSNDLSMVKMTIRPKNCVLVF